MPRDCRFPNGFFIDLNTESLVDKGRALPILGFERRVPHQTRGGIGEAFVEQARWRSYSCDKCWRLGTHGPSGELNVALRIDVKHLFIEDVVKEIHPTLVVILPPAQAFASA